MDIEIGEYVRTKKGKIFRYAKGRAYLGKDNEIVKHSKNIIDLIEVGDIVNNYLVLDIMEDMETGKIQLEMPSSYPKNGSCSIYNDEEIERILTKEQYQANCYTVEGRNSNG